MKIYKIYILSIIFITVFFSTGINFVLAEGGYTWTQQTNSGSRSWELVTSSSDGTKLLATYQSGVGPVHRYLSSDSGATWNYYSGSALSFNSLASSADGTKIVGSVYGGYIYTSTDSGNTFTQQTNSGSRNWNSVTSSSDGTKLAAVVNGGYIYTSTDSGANWVEQTNSGVNSWKKVTSSADGTKLFAYRECCGGVPFSKISSDSGSTWASTNAMSGGSFVSFASSADGTKIVGVASGINIYRSTDSGNTFTELTSSGSRNWQSITSSSDGTKLAAVVNGGYIYTSTDSGANWVEQTSATSKNWQSIASSSDGTKLAAVDGTPGYIYTGFSDSTPPTITNITSTKANGTYSVGEVIDINLTFSEAVTSTGNVTVTLETGATDRTCTFTVASSTTGSCNYTVQSGDTSSDLTINTVSGTIKDASLNSMTDFVPATNLAANKAVVIDTASPVISNVLSSDITSTSSAVSWTTDEAASSIVDYGTTDSYGTSTAELDTPIGVISHSVGLSGLSACTTYHYRVRSKDGVLNLATGSDNTFITTGCYRGGGGILLALLQQQNQPPVTPPTTQPSSTKFTKFINPKSPKDEIKGLQSTLNTILKLTPPLKVDGVFAKKTILAIKKFQKENNITPANGVFGPKTRAVMNGLGK